MMLNSCLNTEKMGCGSNAFKEIEEVKNLISQLKNDNMDVRKIEWNKERFTYIMSQYQEQPHLLDPYLEEILNSMLNIIKDKSISDHVKHDVFKYMFVLMSVKTYKRIVTYLPHEVMDLLPVLKMLEKQNSKNSETWQTRYCLLIWLSIISKIPFPLSRLETSESINQSQTILFRILDICKHYCQAKDACAVAAVFLISNFLTRSDVKKPYLEQIINWCLNCLQKDKMSHGPLAVLASIFKHCAREDLKSHCQILFDNINKLQLSNNSGDLMRRHEMKVVQRIGFVLLRPKLTVWRYQKSQHKISLLSSINRSPVIENMGYSNETSSTEMDDQDIPFVIEEIIEQLIQGLRDKIINIRWSAAKGIGRITSRLPVDLADDVVGFVLNLFSGREQDSAWHGGCLALAELGRRGLLLPHRLNDVIPVVLRALVFDEPRAYGSIGAIIRDAACYVCWSFARAFEPMVFKPFVQQIAATLLIVTCFDREINCRRAASAAFQENVGRQGNFPYGIDILTVADYFEVGVRSHSYLKISVHIAQYKEYTIPVIDHLVQRKVNHWDTAIRELTARTLCNLTPINPHYMVQKILPTLIDGSTSIDLNERHGSILAIAEIIEALHFHFNKNINDIIGIPELEKIQKIVNILRVRGQLKGLGGELMKQACAILIKKSAQVHFPIHSTSMVEDWQILLEECLNHEVSVIKLKAAEAHTLFLTEYYSNGISNQKKRNTLVNRYLENLKSCNQTIRVGFAGAIGYFPAFILEERFKEIFDGLHKCSLITDDTLKWVESRKEALHSLTMILQTLGVENSEVWEASIHDSYDCYLLALGEYTIDSRGDVGAWIREAAMSGLHTLTTLVSRTKLSSKLSEHLMTQIIGGIAQQAVERIDRTRVLAGNIFFSLLHCEPKIPNIPHHEELKIIFPNEKYGENISWNMATDTFPRFIRMLNFPSYTDNVLRGIIFSVGGLSESLVKQSSISLFAYLNDLDENRLQLLLNNILDIFEECHRQERMVTSILAFLDRLLSSGCVQSILDDSNSKTSERILQLLKRERKMMTNTKLIISAIKVFCQLLQIRGNVRKQAFLQLSIMLCSKFQGIRKATAIRTYEAFTLYGEDMDMSEENLNNLLSELNSTNWEQQVEVLRPIRDHLCELMDVAPPISIKKAAT